MQAVFSSLFRDCLASQGYSSETVSVSLGLAKYILSYVTGQFHGVSYFGFIRFLRRKVERLVL